MLAQELDRLVRQPLAVPRVGQATRHPADLGAPEGQPVVVELLAEPYLVGAVGVEGQVDHGALGAQELQRQGQRPGLTPALEDDVGAAVVGSVAPAALQLQGGIAAEGQEAEPVGDCEPVGRLVEHRHLRRAVRPGELRDEQADHARARHRHPAPAHPVAQAPHGLAVQVVGGVQQAVGADRAHVGHVDAHQRVEAGRQFDEAVGHRVGDVAGAVAVGHRHPRAGLQHRGPALDDLADLHVADAAHRVGRSWRALGEQPE
ncbi:hypothetical protein GCM10022248_30810 [Nonomuraea soli]